MSIEIILKSETESPSIYDYQCSSSQKNNTNLKTSHVCIVASLKVFTDDDYEMLEKIVFGKNQELGEHECSTRTEMESESSQNSFSDYVSSRYGDRNFYILIASERKDDHANDNNKENLPNVAIFQVISSQGITDNNEGSYFKLNLHKERKNENSKILIHHHGEDHVSNTSKESIASSTYNLNLLIAYNDHDMIEKNLQWYFEFKTSFECNFFLESLKIISELSEPKKSANEAVYEQTIRSGMKSRIIVKTQCVSPGAYIIIDSNIDMNNTKYDRVNNNQSRDAVENMTKDKATSDLGRYVGKDPLGFYFITPDEKQLLTDYMFIVIAQVKRGALSTSDLSNARRKNSFLQPGYLGLRCRHCGGTKRGHYFPTTCKNLQACPSMIYKHLMTCSECPRPIKKVLKIAKAKHKTQVVRNGTTQIGFFNLLWERIRDPMFSGGSEYNRRGVLKILQDFTLELIAELESESFEQASLKSDTSDNISVRDSSMNMTLTLVEELPSSSKIEYIQPTTQVEIREEQPPSIPLNTTLASSSSFETSSLYGNHFNPVYDSRSLNLTIDMLDEVAFEILNSSNNSNLLALGQGENQIHQVNDYVAETSWEQYCLNSLQDMIDNDEDHREMIEILALIDDDVE